MRFKDEVVLVTGSSRGIGFGIAQAFAEEGASVIINGTSTETVENAVKLLKEQGIPVWGSVFDTANREGTLKAIGEAQEFFGSISILVNNAGISPKKNGKKISIKDMPYEEWTRVMDVNLNGVFTCSQAVIPGMIERRRGKIINISSAFARYYAPLSAAHYITSKTAVIGLTRALAGELAEYGINCNAVAPGRAWTEMTKAQPVEVNEKFMETIPLRKFAEIEDIANTVLFLASKEAGYYTGATLDINGGICMV